jgi:hypothetical protein
MTNKFLKFFIWVIIFSLYSNSFLSPDPLLEKTDKEVMRACLGYDSQRDKYYVYIYDDTTPFNPNWVSCGTYTRSLESTGWDYLTISSYEGEDQLFSDWTKAYGMGYLEAFFTVDRIWNHYLNMKAYHFSGNNGEMKDEQREFLLNNFNWMKEIALEKRNSDPYWYHVYTVIRQMAGMIEGYNHFQKDKSKWIDYANFQVMNAYGDINELSFYKKELRPKFLEMSSADLLDYIDRHNHCSALIKVADDLSDIYFGHNTWTNYSSMTRIFKEYKFKSNQGKEKSTVVAFSGYPGTLTSIDDFYITDTDLYVAETTNQVFNEDLYDNLTHESLLSWVRVLLANRLSDNGREWFEIFKENNSGTYNNQFQILDLKLINYDTVVKEIEDNALWIIEQMPGYVHGEDKSQHLREKGYWPSYNAAYYADIREKSGYDRIIIEKPELVDSIDYDNCARAKIFKRDQSNVKDMDSFKYLMRYNNYQNDELSKNNSGFAIACRRDLNPDDPQCRGATDAKLSSLKNIKGINSKKIFIVSGQTDQQEPFDSINAKCINNPKNPKGESVFNGLPQFITFNWNEYETTIFNNN